MKIYVQSKSELRDSRYNEGEFYRFECIDLKTKKMYYLNTSTMIPGTFRIFKNINPGTVIDGCIIDPKYPNNINPRSDFVIRSVEQTELLI